jgi:hypothetical protein
VKSKGETWKVLSKLAVASLVPSGLKATSLTALL